jgi:hypothetical protein
VLRDLDEDFKENYLDILKRFYVLFESIYKYIVDLGRYVDEVEQGVNFIQATIEVRSTKNRFQKFNPYYLLRTAPF